MADETGCYFWGEMTERLASMLQALSFPLSLALLETAAVLWRRPRDTALNSVSSSTRGEEALRATTPEEPILPTPAGHPRRSLEMTRSPTNTSVAALGPLKPKVPDPQKLESLELLF